MTPVGMVIDDQPRDVIAPQSTAVASNMLPLFRSEAQARLLAWLLLVPTREQSINSLADVAGIAQPNVLKEANRLVRAGLLAERRVGPARLVRANVESPYYEALVVLLARSLGPSTLIPQMLAPVQGIEQVVIVGPWAERYLGRPGPPAENLDVVVIGTPEPQVLHDARHELEGRLGIPVRLTALTPQEWAAGASKFVRTVKEGPFVALADTTA